LSNIKGEPFYYGDKQKRLKATNLKPKDSKYYFYLIFYFKRNAREGS